jgi:threonine/homoserine/homoserine lactone efflux protein
LALGVVVGDILWPILAILGVSWVATQYDGFLDVLKYAATLIFFALGISPDPQCRSVHKRRQ